MGAWLNYARAVMSSVEHHLGSDHAGLFPGSSVERALLGEGRLDLCDLDRRLDLTSEALVLEHLLGLGLDLLLHDSLVVHGVHFVSGFGKVSLLDLFSIPM